MFHFADYNRLEIRLRSLHSAQFEASVPLSPQLASVHDYDLTGALVSLGYRTGYQEEINQPPETKSLDSDQGEEPDANSSSDV